MKIKYSNALLSGLILSSLLMLTACGGSDDSTSEGSLAGNAGSSVDDSSVNDGSLNGGLTGRLVMSNSDLLPIEIDLSTGESRLLPIRTLQGSFPDENLEDGLKVGYFTGSVNGSGYVQSIEKCIDNEISCVATYDGSFNRTGIARLTNVEIDGAAKVSRSGAYVAYTEFFNVTDPFLSLKIVDVVAVTTIDEFQPTFAIPSDADNSPFAWGPNDILAYSVPSDERVSIRITDPLSWTPFRTINLDSRLQGDITSLEFSPDGSKILIGYDPPGILSASVSILDLETLAITVPVVEVGDVNTIPLLDDVESFLVSPRWSPDGRHIMVLSVKSGAGPIIDATTGGATVIAGSEVLWAVPADGIRTVINGDQPTAAIAIAARRVTGGDLTTIYQGATALTFPYFDWVP